MKHISQSRLLLFTVVMLVLTAALAVPAYSIYNNMKSLIEEELGKNAMAVSVSVAKIIEQDLDSYKKLATAESYEPGNYDESYYREMLSIFRELRLATNVTYIYTEKRISDEETMYILDGEDPDSDNFSPLGSTDVIDDYKIRAYIEKKPNYSTLMNYAGWGELISGYAPLIDPATGVVISLVGTDISADKVLSIFTNIKMIIIINFLILLAILGFVIYRMLGITADKIETDYLTGLYSKRFFEGYMSWMGRYAKKFAESFSVIMIDIDNFKEINDRYGHPFGDKALKSVAAVFMEHTRSIDKCARYGGDEFVILMPGVSDNNIEAIGEKIRESVASLSLTTEDGTKVPVTVSIGIAQWNSDYAIDLVTSRADKAMYVAKNTGKNKVSVYTD